ncbi:TetR/AcrR family transcriptional regulator [Gulosibacter chungangensis]|nr:TetR family transcriptional regulator C-terminal domain-containing protein [Gulosibacter chungangensis]
MTAEGTRRGRPAIDPRELTPILEAVLRLAARRSSQLITIREIAAEAGVSVGRLQHHFGSRDDLITQAFEHHLLLVVERFNALREASGPVVERMERVLREVAIARSWERSTIWVDIIARAVVSEKYREIANVINEHWRNLFVELVQEGVDSGEFRVRSSVEDAASHLIAVSDGLSMLVVSGGESAVESGAEFRRRLVFTAANAVLDVDFPGAQRRERLGQL